MHFSTFVPLLLLSVTNAHLHDLAIAAGLKHFGSTRDNGELTSAALVSALPNIKELGQITFGNTQNWDSIEPEPESFAVDLNVKLPYSHSDIENPGKKTTGGINIIKSAEASGMKTDGVELQLPEHSIVGSTPELAVQFAYTELDVRTVMPSTDEQQAVDYRNTVGACNIAVEGCVRVVVAVDERYSWMPSTVPGTGSACPLDEYLARKSAYYGIVAALTGITGKTTHLSNSGVKGGAQFTTTSSTSSNTSKKATNSVKTNSTVPGPKPSNTLIVQTGVSGMLHYTASMVWASWFLGTFFTIILAEIV